MKTMESVIEDVLFCMCSTLATQTGWTGECCVVPAKPSLESCCTRDQDGDPVGFAWGRLVRAWPTRRFPQEDFRGQDFTCDDRSQWALLVELGATICICADMCGCEQKAQNAHDVLAVAEAGLQGAICCFTEGVCAGREYLVTGMQPLMQQADCGGFTIELIIQYDLGCCPPDESP